MLCGTAISGAECQNWALATGANRHQVRPCPLCPDSDQIPHLADMTRRARRRLTHRSKNSLTFRRQTTVKSVTDLPIGAWHRFSDYSGHDPIRDRKTSDAISPDIRPPSGHFPADSAPPVISSQVASARSTTGGTSWFRRYRCCTSFAAASVTRA
jgi:hypothetical protein